MMKEFKYLEELMRVADLNNKPVPNDLHYQYLRDNINYKESFNKRNPGCLIECGDDTTLSVCNCNGNIEPDVIEDAMKQLHKLIMKNPDNEKAATILKKMKFLHKKYSKAIPKPGGIPAYQKGKSTKTMNNIASYIKGIKNDQTS